MTTTEKKKDKDWTLIGCAGLVVIVTAYSLVTTRVASITEEYRRTYIVHQMNENDKLKKNECEIPVADYISVLKRDGISSDGKDEMDMVDDATRDRCFKAQTTISNNRDMMKNAKYLKPSFSHVEENFFK